MTTNDVQKPKGTPKGNSSAGVSCAAAAGSDLLCRAAPDLLAALQRLLRANEADYEISPAMDVATAYETNSQALLQARAAIAKALGQNSDYPHQKGE